MKDNKDNIIIEHAVWRNGCVYISTYDVALCTDGIVTVWAEID